jgi:NAD(P)-dependent dehydrogenase (short-subunit alcohol dehydrogenase family)
MTESGATVAVITGGGGGCALAIARELQREHALLLAEVDGGRLERGLAELREQGVEAKGAIVDVTDPRSVAELARTAAALGRLGPLVHTAGIMPTSAPPETVFAVNFAGTVNVLDAFLDQVGPGTVGVCFSSVGAYRKGMPEVEDLLGRGDIRSAWDELNEVMPLAENGVAAYALAKRGVITLCERRASQWGARGGRLVAVSPGNVDTDMGRAGLGIGIGTNLLVEAASPSRPAHAREVAAVVAFLCSDRAAYVNGCDLRVDGGAIGGLSRRPELRESFETWSSAF